uniref:Uncharacterized protein n=1 Tax=Anguilla anguilla TaxID=7936 RepID=A0A0E9WJ70_ANGAN
MTGNKCLESHSGVCMWGCCVVQVIQLNTQWAVLKAELKIFPQASDLLA